MRSVNCNLDYCKLPLISPGVIQLHKGFICRAYKRRCLYLRGHITGIKKNILKTIAVLIEILFLTYLQVFN